jgi:crotonobetainyl-CoA hydratase/dehydration protein DpgD
VIGGGDSGIRYEKDGEIARVTLERPDAVNAMNQRMHRELALVRDDIETDDDIRAAVLTGAGERAFTVGQDPRERARLDREGTPPTSFGSRGQPG